MMLSTALTEMIDNTECIIFFNTPNSISLATELDQIRKDGKAAKTVSPWIYHELSMTTMLRTVEPDRAKIVAEHFSQDTRSQPQFEYDVSKALEGLLTLTDGHLRQWYENWRHRPIQLREDALGELYKITFPKGK